MRIVVEAETARFWCKSQGKDGTLQDKRPLEKGTPDVEIVAFPADSTMGRSP